MTILFHFIPALYCKKDKKLGYCKQIARQLRKQYVEARGHLIRDLEIGVRSLSLLKLIENCTTTIWGMYTRKAKAHLGGQPY